MRFKKNQTFIIAEIGNNHEGSYKVAKKLVSKAIECGADAIKLQSIDPMKLYDRFDNERIDRLKKYMLSDDQIYKLSEYCKKKRKIFFSTPFDIETANRLNKYQNCYKIASSDNNYIEFIKHILSFKKHTFISTGLMNLDEIEKILINPLINKFGKKFIYKNITLLHCVSKYPVEFELSNIFKISKMKEKFKHINIGYSDHTIGLDASVYAILLGANVIEKHFTLDNYFSDFRDHKLSLNPKDFLKLVNKIRQIDKLKLVNTNKIDVTEKRNIKLFRRSLSAKQDIKLNDKINLKNITWLRPGNGILFEDFKEFKGKIANKDIKKNSKIYKRDIK